jgi:DNA-binding beta-propeller fold protein YncE
MKAKTLCSTFAVAVILTVPPLELSAKTIGMVADDTTKSVTVFDADTHVVLGTVPLPSASGFTIVGDVLITPDLKLGFVTNFNNEIFVIDLTTSPPSLTGGTNPIPISNLGHDLSISPDGKFLVVSGGGSFQPISVIDIAARTEVSTFPAGAASTSVDVCSDGSVLTASAFDSMVQRFTLSDTGTLTDTGEVLNLSDPVNVYCAPGATSGVVITFVPGEVTSFKIPLATVDTRPLSGGSAMTGAIAPAGNRLFVRSNGPGSVDVFDFNSATGALRVLPRSV